MQNEESRMQSGGGKSGKKDGTSNQSSVISNQQGDGRIFEF
jgi:hypothetical protein